MTGHDRTKVKVNAMKHNLLNGNVTACAPCIADMHIDWSKRHVQNGQNMTQHTTDRKEQDEVTHLLPMTSPCSWISIPRSLNIWFTSIMSVYRHTYNNQHFTTAHSSTLYGNHNTVKLHPKNYYCYFWLVFNWARFAFSALTSGTEYGL